MSGRRWRCRCRIHTYCEEVLRDFSINDVTHTVHDLLKMPEQMKRLDDEHVEQEGEEADEPA